MSEVTLPEVEQTISERVDQLGNYLLRAGKAHKAAILFATYLSEFTRTRADKKLEEKLIDHGEQIVHIRVSAKTDSVDLPYYLRCHPQKGKAIFFIYDLVQAGETAVKYLNYRREYFIEDQQRILFWVHETEIGKLARTAPDFWAFRGRTIAFLDTPTTENKNELLSDLRFFNYHGNIILDKNDLENGIRLRQELLAELPPDEMNNASRAELLYTLAIYNDMAQKPEQGLMYLEQAIDLAKTAAPHLLPYLFNAKGNILHRLGQNIAALEAYDRSIDIAPEEAGTHSNRGIVLNDLGRYNDALEAFAWALELNPKFANALNGKGNTYLHLGRYEEALNAFNKAIEHDATSAYIYNNQGNALRDMDRQEEALAAFDMATKLDPDYAVPWLNKALLAMQQQKPDEAIHDLTVGLQKAPQYRQWVATRPAFVSLRGTSKFKALLR